MLRPLNRTLSTPHTALSLHQAHLPRLGKPLKNLVFHRASALEFPLTPPHASRLRQRKPHTR